MVQKYFTIFDDLEAAADLSADNLRSRGFNLKVEDSSVEYPSTPTFLARRNPTKCFVFVVSKIELEVLDDWLSYCRSCDTDTRISVFYCNKRSVPYSRLKKFLESGVGLYVKSPQDVKYTRFSEEKDLSISIKLPERKNLPAKQRKLLGEAFDKFDRGDWKAGFDTSVKVLEDGIRDYVTKKHRRNQGAYMSGTKKKILTDKQIQKLTLGGLKDVVCNSLVHNAIDSRICSGLSILNPTRIAAIHRAGAASTEKKLRNRVGKDIWIIINLLKVID